jgi:hypothetical protein
MTDRELLELAAKAAGYTTIQYQNLKDSYLDIRYGIDEAIWNGEDYWNPLEDDCEALRLAVKLGLRIEINTQVLGDTLVSSEFYDHVECHNNNPLAATRRAIVRAAAEIGKNMGVTK